MTELNRNIVMDLLPLYISGETSPETTESIKHYLETDPELAEIAKEMAKADSLNKVPIPFRKEAAMETYQEAKKWMTIRLLGFALIGAVIFLCTMFVVFAYLIIGK